MIKGKNSPYGTLYLSTSAVIAALYVVLTLPFAQIAQGPVQFRLAEIMVVLPILTPAAIPGLAIGCFLANLLSPSSLGVIDVVFGTIATLISAVLTRLIFQKVRRISETKRSIAALIPPVLVNALIVGTYLPFIIPAYGQITGALVAMSILYVGLSETLVVYAIGLPFLLVLKKTGISSIWQKSNNQNPKPKK